MSADQWEDLKRLNEMLKAGEVTRDEYELIKTDLLSEIQDEPAAVRTPGWYSDPEGVHDHQAYWDGLKWTGATRGVPIGSMAASGKSPLYKRPWFVGLVLVFGVAVVGSALANGGTERTADSDNDATLIEATSTSPPGTNTTEAGEVVATESPQSTEPAQQLTRAQENAIRSAESYLSFTAFSRSGLIDQLKFEEFSPADATFAVDYLDVDWREQAIVSAEQYLDFSAFSRSGLIDQLEFEGFSKDEATHGVDSITVDWNEQAWMSAESYLDFSGFSRAGLIDQLIFDGFTQSEANYGVDKAGL